MPQLVALLNGLGGAASVLVAGSYLSGKTVSGGLSSGAGLADVLAATAASGFIGGITFTGSLVAWGKLEELKWLSNFDKPWKNMANISLTSVSLGLCVLTVTDPGHAVIWFWLMSILALVLGVLLVVSIGGADMPVVIALLNSYSGLAAAATGFVINNNLLIIAGSLVGASGVILTKIMCDAMNDRCGQCSSARCRPKENRRPQMRCMPT